MNKQIPYKVGDWVVVDSWQGPLNVYGVKKVTRIYPSRKTGERYITLTGLKSSGFMMIYKLPASWYVKVPADWQENLDTLIKAEQIRIKLTSSNRELGTGA